MLGSAHPGFNLRAGDGGGARGVLVSGELYTVDLAFALLPLILLLGIFPITFYGYLYASFVLPLFDPLV